jgi:hypothetical protein
MAVEHKAHLYPAEPPDNRDQLLRATTRYGIVYRLLTVAVGLTFCVSFHDINGQFQNPPLNWLGTCTSDGHRPIGLTLQINNNNLFDWESVASQRELA